MPTIRDPSVRAALLARVDRLRPEMKPQWGVMSAGQMLAHLSDAARMALGDIQVTPRNVWFTQTTLFKYVFLNVISFPKNAPSAKEITSRTPASFDAERESLKALTARLAPDTVGTRFAAHPLFGKLTAAEWGILAHKHMDHHLRQFGV
jgi:Protein of unknown function (DUF1569)